jgi:glutathione S-transferase
MNVFHIVSTEAWDAVSADAAAADYQPESLATEGFIHFSYAGQVAATAERYYRDVDGLQVLEVDPARLATALCEERSPVSGELYPHLYGPLPIAAVVAIHPLSAWSA